MDKKEIDNRFGGFGKISFTSVTKINDFIGYLQEGKVKGTKCKTCGEIYFPPRADCCASMDSAMDWFEVQGCGTLQTFSTLYYAPAGLEKDLPYSIAVVDFGSFRMFGHLDTAIAADRLRIGMKLEVYVQKLSGKQIIYGFRETR